ncbi:NUDIX hydrolase [Desulfosoma caldarium]|uniref:ADP-ribose pyrophosphatase YjhB (NUDIX family) n=1 Tax=Desulfosoma caldarium TaxID=610254 RepID=A0A3N1UX28_9BACT|nr:NUDIX hydrolase [Desulfosoma caldarium]ROQ93240.1 ADP-ribose pyrophosphatase YjhB (NUDIX family) [Desulfosoma caldarium]
MSDRQYPDRPLVGVGAVVFLEGDVLLVRRGREPAYGLWSLPGGLVKLGESLDAAVRREVLEETGLQVKVVDVVACLDRVFRDTAGRIAYHYVLVDFLCEPLSGHIQPGSDVLDCAYFAPHKLHQVPITPGAAEVIQKADRARSRLGFSIYDPLL